MRELRRRSALKSFIWRITGVVILAGITYAYTGDFIKTSLVVIIHHTVFLLVFYVHERIWLKINMTNMMQRSLAKMLTYETLCGNVILGTITYLITGSWKQMTAITFTYIGIKHIVFVWNEYIWKEIRWAKKDTDVDEKGIV